MKPEELDELIKNIKWIADLDGEITDDEKNILISVKNNVDEFKIAYKEAIEDGVITNEEEKKLRMLWQKIGIDASKTANDDQIFTMDELIIIGNIFKTIFKGMDKI